MRHVASTEDANTVLSMADLVIYGSFLEEQAFPDILIKAMCFGKPIIAPDISVIRKYVCFYAAFSLDTCQSVFVNVIRSIRCP